MTFHIREHVVPASYIREYPGATAHNQEELLHLHVKQYTPADGTEIAPDAVTIIGATGVGFPKVSHRMGLSCSQKPNENIAGTLRAVMGRNLPKVQSPRI